MAPDLFAGILAQVPFVDPLTTILDPSLPLTVTEWDEWGNPLSDSDVYHYMKSYSPVRERRRPEVSGHPCDDFAARHPASTTSSPRNGSRRLRHSKTDGTRCC